MSLKDNIGDFSPNNFDDGVKIDWKVLEAYIAEGGVGIGFYFRLFEVSEFTTKKGKQAWSIKGHGELGTKSLTAAQIAEQENLTGLSASAPKKCWFYPVGSMFNTMMTKAYGENWKTAESVQGRLMYLKYNGKVKSEDGTLFHQIFIYPITEVDE